MTKDSLLKFENIETYSKLHFMQIGKIEMSFSSSKASLTNLAFIIFSSSFKTLWHAMHILKSSGLTAPNSS